MYPTFRCEPPQTVFTIRFQPRRALPTLNCKLPMTLRTVLFLICIVNFLLTLFLEIKCYLMYYY